MLPLQVPYIKQHDFILIKNTFFKLIKISTVHCWKIDEKRSLKGTKLLPVLLLQK